MSPQNRNTSASVMMNEIAVVPKNPNAARHSASIANEMPIMLARPM